MPPLSGSEERSLSELLSVESLRVKSPTFFLTRLLEPLLVLGASAGNSLSPPSIAIGFKILPHEFDHFSLTEAGLFLYLFKAGSVFPSHSDDLVLRCLIHTKQWGVF